MTDKLLDCITILQEHQSVNSSTATFEALQPGATLFRVVRLMLDLTSCFCKLRGSSLSKQNS
jgi:hypothetical protein